MWADKKRHFEIMGQQNNTQAAFRIQKDPEQTTFYETRVGEDVVSLFSEAVFLWSVCNYNNLSLRLMHS